MCAPWWVVAPVCLDSGWLCVPGCLWVGVPVVAAVGDALPCRVAFERGKEKKVLLLVASSGPFGWILLAESGAGDAPKRTSGDPTLPGPPGTGPSSSRGRGGAGAGGSSGGGAEDESGMLTATIPGGGAPCWLPGALPPSFSCLLHATTQRSPRPSAGHVECRTLCVLLSSRQQGPSLPVCVCLFLVGVWVWGQPDCDPKHKRWLHLRIRSPQQPPTPAPWRRAPPGLPRAGEASGRRALDPGVHR